jgi:hypothetical protein
MRIYSIIDPYGLLTETFLQLEIDTFEFIIIFLYIKIPIIKFRDSWLFIRFFQNFDKILINLRIESFHQFL